MGIKLTDNTGTSENTFQVGSEGIKLENSTTAKITDKDGNLERLKLKAATEGNDAVVLSQIGTISNLVITHFSDKAGNVLPGAPFHVFDILGNTVVRF